MLPQDCVSTILSLTSPIDACRSSLVSSLFSSASESDLVWERFLPSDHHELISRLVNFDKNNNPLKFSNKKELFFHLCNPVLIDGGTKSFKIDRSSGKKSYLLSARELIITWSDEPMYWSWKNMPQSRFNEAVELRTISWLEIHGEIRTQTLSKNTTYSAYLVMSISNRAYGLSTSPFEASIQVGDRQVCHSAVSLCKHDRDRDRDKIEQHSIGCGEVIVGSEKKIESVRERMDGWMEIKLGDFFAGEVDQQVKMCLSETKGYHLKAGLVIEGIEVRPN